MYVNSYYHGPLITDKTGKQKSNLDLSCSVLLLTLMAAVVHIKKQSPRASGKKDSSPTPLT